VTTLTERDEGTSNSERIAAEAHSATSEVDERFPGYRELVARSALECFLLTAEHGEARTNINQKYDQIIRTLAREIGQQSTLRSEG
jgi:hypothetical protein